MVKLPRDGPLTSVSIVYLTKSGTFTLGFRLRYSKTLRWNLIPKPQSPPQSTLFVMLPKLVFVFIMLCVRSRES